MFGSSEHGNLHFYEDGQIVLRHGKDILLSVYGLEEVYKAIKDSGKGDEVQAERATARRVFFNYQIQKLIVDQLIALGYPVPDNAQMILDIIEKPYQQKQIEQKRTHDDE